jgi:hypothetical protein
VRTICLYLALCASAYAADKAPSSSPAQLSATHGFVRVSLAQEALETGLSLRAPSARKAERLSRDTTIGRYTYGAWLPAGDYQVEGLKSADGSPYQVVTVRAGQMTDLGAVLQLQLGGYQTVLLAIAHPEAAAEAAAARKRFDKELVGETIEWRPTAPPMANKSGTPGASAGLVVDLLLAYDRRVNKPAFNTQMRSATTVDELYRLAKLAVAPDVDEPGVDPEGNSYYGADFGQLRVRRVNAEWQTLDTGTLASIAAVEIHGDRMFAGTADGAIRSSDDRGQTWREVARVGEGETLLDIDVAAERLLVLAATTTRDHRFPRIKYGAQIKLYSATADQPNDLAFVRVIANVKQVRLRVPGISDAFAGQAVGDIYYVNAVDDVQRLDARSMQWSTLKPPHRVSSLHIAGKPTVLTALLAQGMFSKVSLSTDEGATWTPYNRPPYAIYDVGFVSPDIGSASRWSSGAFSATLEFLSYDPNKKAWSKTHEAPFGCKLMLRDATYAQQHCVTSGGSILAYVDNAWIAEFAVE